MKRNPDLIRELLQNIEDCPADNRMKFSVDAGDDVDTMKHLELLIDAGYVKGAVLPDMRGPVAIVVSGLTWEGHDFVSAVRDNGIWQKTKENVLQPAASWTFGMILEYAKAEARSRLGM